VSNLFVSFGEISNLCILGIIFLGSYLAFIYVSFYSLWLSLRQSQAHQKWFSDEKIIVFLVLKVLPIHPF
jgi:hypothetical protein